MNETPPLLHAVLEVLDQGEQLLASLGDDAYVQRVRACCASRFPRIRRRRNFPPHALSPRHRPPPAHFSGTNRPSGDAAKQLGALKNQS